MDAVTCYPDKAPTVDRALDTLGDNLRREVIHYFENFNSGKTATVEELVTHLDKRIPHKDPGELSIVLLHTHLPKLQVRGWLDFDRRNETIRYRGHESVKKLLEEVTEVFAE